MRPAIAAVVSLLFLPPALVLSPSAPLRGAAPAEASVSLLLRLDELVASSSLVIVGTAAEKKSRWEDLAGNRRIVTYTLIKVERSIVGAAGAEIWVRTLGGSVGNLGQAVSGEAQIAAGSRSLLFLMKRGDSVVVTGMAQGHFPVVSGEKDVSKLQSSPGVGTFLAAPGLVISARDVLVGAALEKAVLSITKARRTLDENKK